MESMDRLRAILAKSTQKPKSSSTKFPTPDQKSTYPSSPKPAPSPHSEHALQYPAVHVPGSSSRPATGSSLPKHDSFNNLLHTKIAFNTDNDEHNRVPGADKHSTDQIQAYNTSISSPAPTSTSTKVILQVRKVSHPAPSHPPLEPVARISTLSAEDSGSTLSLTSTLSSLLPPQEEINTSRNVHNKMATTREVKSSIWDPEEDEWMDAGEVVETFKASYKIPALRSGTKGWGATIKSVLVPLTKKSRDGEEDRIEELRNTWNYDPQGDAHDEVMRGVFLKPSGYFPGRVPDSPRSMHIIDLNAYFDSTDPFVRHAWPRLCDAVATVLSHTSKECLQAFLDPSIKEFIYRRKVDNNEGGLILIIRREGNEVICGAYRNLGFKKLWKLYVKSSISITGQWHEIYATVKTGEMFVTKGVPDWGTIESEIKVDKWASTGTESAQRKLELSPLKKIAKHPSDVAEKDRKFMLYQSRVLATQLLWDMWCRFDKKYECWATWTADGLESDVRLTRALVGSGNLED
jgi:hypothetical protein